jgi:tRNA-splicing ligase RtcB (3'-phosphate/5'-hydroxy nucleic acid ligase)
VGEFSGRAYCRGQRPKVLQYLELVPEMVEHAADFEWRGEGEDAEVVLYAPEAASAERGFEQVMPAASLPGVVSPVHAAVSGSKIGWVAASETHAAPDLFSAPTRGLLLVANASVGEFGVSPGEMGDLILRNLSEVSPPRFGEAEVRRAVEDGAMWAAEEGLIPEEDLALFGAPSSVPGEPDALPRRALSAGAHDFGRRQRMKVYTVAEILNADHAEALGLGIGALVLHVETVPEDLGRLALTAHRERILKQVWSRDFGATADLPAAPLETEEAADLLAAVRAVANYVDARAALLLYELRRVFIEEGGVHIQAAWRLGGLAQRDDLLLHRHNLAAIEGGDILSTRDFAAAGTGAMRASAPTFGAGSEEEPWAWEEAGLLERVARLWDQERDRT